MKKTLLFLLLLIMATTMSAQTQLKGDMDNNGQIGIADVTALVNVALGKTSTEFINVYVVDNSSIVGTWYAPNSTSLTFNANGTTNYPGGSTYEYMPSLGLLKVYNAVGEVVGGKFFKAIAPEYLLEENTINGTFTYYTNSANVVTSITLNQTSLSIKSGSTSQLNATVTPASALITDVIWQSSDESVATVNAEGLVTAVSRGSCTITCTAKDGGGASASCAVTVTQLVTGITLNQSTLSLNNIGTTSQLTAAILPSNASNKGVTWKSSNAEVATVSQNGLVTAVSNGTCTITCTAKDGSGKKATCSVTVSQWVTGITLNKSTLNLNAGATSQLTTTIQPANAANKSVTWTSSNSNVATVSQSGLVTAVGSGICTITCAATDGSGKNAICTVSVTQLVTGITLSMPTLSLNTGTTSQLTATVLPANASNKNVTWTSSDENVAMVNANGLVTAIVSGTCTITCSATDGSGKKGTCTVTVKQLVTSITLNQSSLSLVVGMTSQLEASIQPANASNKNVNWSSSDSNVATVSQTGLITAVDSGTCIIICEAADGSGVQETCSVVVYSHAYVDLGLPSGTLWATCNIGADNPEDCGDYFAWGETTGYNDGKTDFSWSTYQYYNDNNSGGSLTKYCNVSGSGYNGFTDTLTELELEDDAAYVNWGPNWRMPSKDQQDELCTECTKTWTTQNGVQGCLVTGPNGNSIFLPCTGYREGTSFGATACVQYWSRTLDTSNPYKGYYLEIWMHSKFGMASGTDVNYRGDGQCIRPVRVSQ